MMNGNPHVSQAVKQLRSWVSLASLVVVLSATAQMLVFGFVHYTDVRYTTLTVKKDAPPLTIVAPAAESAAGVPAGSNAASGGAGAASAAVNEKPPALDRSARLRAPGQIVQTVEINRVKSSMDRVLGRTCAAACGFGAVSAICLCLLTILGVAVAGGGSIPGVDRVVTACVWAMVIAILCLPWKDLMPSMPMPGMFIGYELMTAASEKAISTGEGTLLLLCQWVAFPVAVAICGGLVSWWFRQGVNAGVIVTSVSELEEAAEREMVAIQRRGVAQRAPRSVGALHRAIGDTRPAAPQPAEEAVGAATEIAASLARSGATDSARGRTRGVVDEDYKRPI